MTRDTPPEKRGVVAIDAARCPATTAADAITLAGDDPGNARGRTRAEARRRSAKRAELSARKLFFVTNDPKFAADFVVVRTVVGAKRAFSQMYSGELRSVAELVLVQRAIANARI